MPPPDMFDGISKGAQTAIRAYCGWHIAPVITETLVLDGTGTRSFQLPTLRLLEVTSLEVDGSAVVDPEFSRAGIVRVRSTERFRTILVTFRHGFESSEVADIQANIAGIDRLLRLQGGNARVGQVQFSLGGLNPGGFDAYTASVLDRYALPAKAGLT